MGEPQSRGPSDTTRPQRARCTPDRRIGPRRYEEQQAAERRLREQVQAAETAAALERANAAIRLGAERQRSLIAASGDVITLKDPMGRMLEDVAGWEAFTGQSPEQWAGYGWMDALHPDDRPWIEEWWRTPPSDRVARDLESRIRRRDGVYRAVQVRFAPVVDPNGRVREWLATLIDVTHRWETEARLYQLEEQFLQAQKMGAIGQLAGGVAHDFNNLLTVISAAAEALAADPSLAPAAQAELADLRSAASQARDLTRRLLAFSRQQPERTIPLSLSDVVRGFEPLLRRLVGTSIQLESNLDDDAGYVLADRAQLEQVLANLVVNAKDAMPGGGKVTITVAKAGEVPADAVGPAVEREPPSCGDDAGDDATGTPGRYVCIGVQDTGVGMDPATQARIFEPFFTTKPVGKGTGLGLAMVLGVVSQAGGAVRVTSQLGQGTTFYLYFPACATATTGPRRTTERRRAGRTRARPELRPASSAPVAAPPGTAPAPVLVVEDDPTLRRVIMRILSRGGYEALEADQAEAALELLAERSATHGGDPDLSLIITDLVMPEGMGQQLITTVHERWPDLPILVASGYAGDPADGDGAARLDLPKGATLLRKPFGVAELLAAVRRLVARP